MSRLVIWYSHGAASLLAAKMAVDAHKGKDVEIVVANIYIEEEVHEPELVKWAEGYLGVRITTIRDHMFGASVNEVVRRFRYMSGIHGAPCTRELKKRVRRQWQREDDVHVFGFDVNEASRIDNVLDAEPNLIILAPLVDAGLSKADCFATLMRESGYRLPKMYQLGYHNNNCPGCLKAQGAGYWNKIREDFPEVFETRCAQSELTGAKLVRMCKTDVVKFESELRLKMGEAFSPDAGGRLRIPLRVLPIGAKGSHKDLDIGDCGIVCEHRD